MNNKENTVIKHNCLRLSERNCQFPFTFLELLRRIQNFTALFRICASVHIELNVLVGVAIATIIPDPIVWSVAGTTLHSSAFLIVLWAFGRFSCGACGTCFVTDCWPRRPIFPAFTSNDSAQVPINWRWGSYVFAIAPTKKPKTFSSKKKLTRTTKQ